jgi:hypothetical protein
MQSGKGWNMKLKTFLSLTCIKRKKLEGEEGRISIRWPWNRDWLAEDVKSVSTYHKLMTSQLILWGTRISVKSHNIYKRHYLYYLLRKHVVYRSKAVGSSSCGSTPTSHCRVSGSVPDDFMWGLWWTIWHWSRIFSESIQFSSSQPQFCTCSIHFCRYSLICTLALTRHRVIRSSIFKFRFHLIQDIWLVIEWRNLSIDAI